MDSLFGKQRADKLRTALVQLQPSDRELAVVGDICQALKDHGGKYVLPFRFRNKGGSKTSHHLIFVSKHIKGYEIMKGIMAGESSDATQGVASFEYTPVKVRQMPLFGPPQPLENLAEMLIMDFANRTLTMKQVYEEHNIDRPYIERNYKDALMRLESDGRIKVEPHRKGTFGDNVVVTFPPKRKGK